MRQECLVVALSPSVRERAAEAKYVLRLLARIAGFGEHFRWADPAGPAPDVYYGPSPSEAPGAAVRILASSRESWNEPGDPDSLREAGGLPFVVFPGDPPPEVRRDGDTVDLVGDVVRSSFWVLVGLGERSIPRDARDNFLLGDAFVWKSGLMRRPIVSIYGAWLRDHFASRGRSPRLLPWTEAGKQAAFSFTHDVDYPEMVRSIECLRLIRSRGLSAWASVIGVASGRNHFWKFGEWVEWQKSLGTRPTFYFSAVRGSLPRYALGTPDCLYDIRSPRFRALFQQLWEEGCEVGLHASYHAFHSPSSLAAERLWLQHASDAECAGLRHHYWRLNPTDPHETLEFHERAGFLYDASLGFEFGPGFRRGICHPFRAYSVAERRALGAIQLPTAWMDDHFDRRLAWNRVASPADSARGLIASTRATGGVIVVDYHARGMNADFYPRYGAWLERFVAESCGSETSFARAGDVVRDYVAYEAALDALSADDTAPPSAQVAGQVGWHPDRAGPLRVAVLTTEGSRYGRSLVQALAARGILIHLIVVAGGAVRARSRAVRRLTARAGWWNAGRIAFAEWWHPRGPSPSTIPGRPYTSLAARVQRVASVRSPELGRALKDAAIDLLLLGQSGIVPAEVLAQPSIGTLNAHPGRLPEYRGLDCAAWAVRQGQLRDVGGTVHWVTERIDGGPIIRWVPYRWRGDESLRRLEERLADDCIRLLVDAVDELRLGRSLPALENRGGGWFATMTPGERRDASARLADALVHGPPAGVAP